MEARIEQGKEPVTVQALIAQSAVEALDVCVLHGFAGLYEAQLDACVRSPCVEGATSEFRAIVEREARRCAALIDHVLQRLDHGDAGEAVCGNEREALMRTNVDDSEAPEAAREGEEHLRALVSRVAVVGRLRVDVEHATRLIAAAGNGVTLSLLAEKPSDARLAASMREAVLAAVTVPASDSGIAGGEPGASVKRTPAFEATGQDAAWAVALRTVLDEQAHATSTGLSSNERQLLGEWLNRLALA